MTGGVESVTAWFRHGFRRLAAVPPQPSSTPRPQSASATLRVAVCLVGGEALALFGLAAAELLSVEGSRVGLGVTTAVFFAACGAGLGLSGAGLWRLRTWSRGPVVVAQLLVLGVSWSTRSLPVLAVLLATWALAVLVLVLRPATTDELSE